MKQNDIKLYSISKAAKEMGISRESVNALIAEGLLGVITIKKNKKISHLEIIKYQNENTIRTKDNYQSKIKNQSTLNGLFDNKVKTPAQNSGKEILENIIRKDKNGNSKKEG